MKFKMGKYEIMRMSGLFRIGFAQGLNWMLILTFMGVVLLALSTDGKKD